jgi:hypothetical protein
MRLFRLFIAALALFAVGLQAPLAHAVGTVTIGAPMWGKRSQTDRKLDSINRRDCLDDATVSFLVTIAGNPGGAFEVWAGVGCDAIAGRTAATATCVRVLSGSGNLTQTVTVRVQNLIKPLTTGDAEGTAATCDENTSSSASSRSLFFIDYDTGSNMSLIAKTPTWAYKYDTIPPKPPTGISASAGESSLIPKFTAPAGESNIIRYHFYCSQAGTPVATSTGGTDAGGTETGGTAGAAALDIIGGSDTGGATGVAGTDTGGTAGTDTGGTSGTETGGTAGTAGTSGTTSSSSGGTGGTTDNGLPSDDSTCGSDTLVPGKAPPDGLAECGSVAAQGTSQGNTNTDLENGIRYAVAIAAEDDQNNIGNLSKLACGVPEEVTGFFEAYRAAGGEAGGGYCTFAPATRHAAAIAVLMLLGACALVARRRR